MYLFFQYSISTSSKYLIRYSKLGIYSIAYSRTYAIAENMKDQETKGSESELKISNTQNESCKRKGGYR